MTRNPGHCPPEAKGKRVRVVLANGQPGKQDWPADGTHGCRWSITGQPHDIREYEVVT